MLRDLLRGDDSVPFFVGDKQGLAQKQSVHGRVCACPSGPPCAAEVSAIGPGLLVGVLALLGTVLMVLAGHQRSAGAMLGMARPGVQHM